MNATATLQKGKGGQQHTSGILKAQPNVCTVFRTEAALVRVLPEMPPKNLTPPPLQKKTQLSTKQHHNTTVTAIHSVGLQQRTCLRGVRGRVCELIQGKPLEHDISS